MHGLCTYSLSTTKTYNVININVLLYQTRGGRKSTPHQKQEKKEKNNIFKPNAIIEGFINLYVLCYA